MKTTLLLGVALAALTTAQAQIFRTSAVNGAVAHAARGHSDGERNRGDRGRGDWGHRDDGRREHGRYIYRDEPRVHIGFGHSSGRWHAPYRHSHFGYYGRHAYWPRYYSYGIDYVPSYGYYSGYGYGYPYYDGYGYYGSGSAATNGFLLGALAGGIIGHNSGDFRHNGWRGAAWGAGAGWLLGSIIDANRRPVVYQTAPVAVQSAPVTQVQPNASQPQQVTIINNYYNTSTPMTAANGLFGR